MDINYALKLIEGLADGVNPLTGEVLPQDSVCNQADIIRAFHCVLKYCEDKKNLPVNAGKPWTSTEEDKLCDEHDSGVKINDIAKEHGRTRKAIISRLRKLGFEVD